MLSPFLLVAILVSADAPPAPALGGTNATPLGSPGRWIGPDDYPKAAWRDGAEGATRFTLKIDRAGGVADCTVTESSGNEELDGATCVLLTARARFAPATDENHQPVEGRYASQVRWVMPTPVPFFTLDMVTELDVDAKGRPSSCVSTGRPMAMPPALMDELHARTMDDPCDRIMRLRDLALWVGSTPVKGGGHVVMRTSVAITPKK